MLSGSSSSSPSACSSLTTKVTAPNVDRVNALVPHPTAANVLLVCSDDRGNPTARIWDVEAGKVVVETALPKGGVSSVAWSPDGSLLAVATKNKQIHVLDPRNPSSLSSSPSHDSVRPVRLAWASESHLVSTGFNRSASRELILTTVDRSSSSAKLTQISKISLDVSPAPLFPFVDLDTRILFLYSRGERSMPLYELDLSPNAKQPFDKLSSAFEHGTLQSGFAFLPKTRADVKAVEVVKAFRLSPHEVQVVSFTVPRAKVRHLLYSLWSRLLTSLPRRSSSSKTTFSFRPATQRSRPSLLRTTPLARTPRSSLSTSVLQE
jgi:coronin-7